MPDLQHSALANGPESSCETDICQLNPFSARRAALAGPRVPLSASDAAKASYLQSVVNDPKTFAPVAERALPRGRERALNLFREAQECADTTREQGDGWFSPLATVCRVR